MSISKQAVKLAESRCERARLAILDQLRWLQENIRRAIAAAQAGESVDEHLIHNAVQVTAEIGRYNVLRDLLPALKTEDS